MNFRVARKNAGVKLREAAEVLGVSEQAVSQWEQGIKLPRADKLLILADLYHCTVEYLLRED